MCGEQCEGIWADVLVFLEEGNEVLGRCNRDASGICRDGSDLELWDRVGVLIDEGALLEDDAVGVDLDNRWSTDFLLSGAFAGSAWLRSSVAISSSFLYLNVQFLREPSGIETWIGSLAT